MFVICVFARGLRNPTGRDRNLRNPTGRSLTEAATHLDAWHEGVTSSTAAPTLAKEWPPSEDVETCHQPLRQYVSFRSVYTERNVQKQSCRRVTDVLLSMTPVEWFTIASPSKHSLVL